MTDIYEAWVDFGIDGFRIDTVKHVNVEFWQVFAAAIAARAEADGNPDFFAFGEVFDAEPGVHVALHDRGGPAGDDRLRLPGQSTEGSPRAVRRSSCATCSPNDDYYTDTDSNAYSLPTFLGNHDMGRIGKFIYDERRQRTTSCSPATSSPTR